MRRGVAAAYRHDASRCEALPYRRGDVPEWPGTVPRKAPARWFESTRRLHAPSPAAPG